MLGRDISLRPYNTFGMDVRAKLLAHASSADEARGLLTDPSLRNERLLLLGGGSNILLTRDFDGLVLRNGILGIQEIARDSDSATIYAGGGVVWHHLVMHTVEAGLGGIENLSLIPGSVGAAPMQNIGAYGAELRDTFLYLDALHLTTGEMQRFSHSDCRFGYRESVFKRELAGQYLITGVALRLRTRPELNTGYGAITRELEAMGVHSPTLRDVSEAVIRIRQGKLPDPALLGNAGSFFKNPVVPESLASELRIRCPQMPVFAAEGGVKLAAGWLIEQCGWKGRRQGDAGCHRDQALVIVNHGHATGEQILAFAKQVAQSVRDTFGVDLEMEVNVVG